MSQWYSFVKHNKQALVTKDLFIEFPYKLRRSIYRMPYEKRFNKEETMYYVFEEYFRQVLLDIIENNTIFVHRCGNRDITIQKVPVCGEEFEMYYKLGRFNLDYLKSNFTGHFIKFEFAKNSSSKGFKNIFLSGDLKIKRDKASEIW